MKNKWRKFIFVQMNVCVSVLAYVLIAYDSFIEIFLNLFVLHFSSMGYVYYLQIEINFSEMPHNAIRCE